MGSTSSAPQLQAPQLQGKSVKRGDVINFRWVADCVIFAQWMKDGQPLQDGGRISITQSDDSKCFSLTIKDARAADDGEYTLELWNSNGTVEGSAKVTVLEYDVDWRKINWKENNVKALLSEMHPRNPNLHHLRFLLHGPVGAGKSSIINSINCVFQKRININAFAAAASGTSYTKIYKTHPIKDQHGGALPYVFNDVMGFENKETAGVLTADIISALRGHVKEGYKFNPVTPLTEGGSYYKSSPTLNDKVHCLVSVISANRISLMKDTDGVIIKMREVREAASEIGIPQVVFMTHVDLCCPLVQEDLKHIYSSKKIKQAMQHCSNKLGVPMNCIFPVKNYSEENDVNDKTDRLILDATKQVVSFTNDYVEDI